MFADVNSGGVSGTGTGETFMRATVARRIAVNMEQGSNPETGINEALGYMTNRVGGEGGAIAISALTGEIGLGWNSKQVWYTFIEL